MDWTEWILVKGITAICVATAMYLILRTISWLSSKI